MRPVRLRRNPRGDVSDLSETGTLRSETQSFALLGMVSRLGQGGSVLLAAVLLDPAQFGQLGVLIGAQVLTMMLAAQWFEPAILRVGSTSDNRTGAISISLARSIRALQARGSLAAALVAFVLTWFAAAALDISANLLLLATLAAVVRSFALFLPTAMFRACGDVGSLQTLLATCWGLAFLFRVGGSAVLPSSPLGFVVGDLAAALIFGFVAFRRVLNAPQRPTAQEERIAVGWRDVALVPHFVAIWALGYADRFFLVGEIDGDLLGHYEISYQLGALIGFVALELSRAAMAQYALAANDGAVSLRPRLRRAENSFLLLVAGAAAVVSGVAALTWNGLPFLSDYGDYAGILGIVAAAQIPLALYSLAAIRIANVTGDTQRLWLASVGGAAAGLFLLAQVVPTGDLSLVAASSVVGFGVTMTIALVLDRSEAASRKSVHGFFVAAFAGLLVFANASLHDSGSAMTVLVVLGLVMVVRGLHRWITLDRVDKTLDLVDITNS